MDDFKLDLTRPAPRPKTLEEAQQIIDGLWEVVGGLKARLDELEEQLQTGSDNSSRPPSQDSPKRRAERKRKRPTGRKKGAQPGHAKHKRSWVPETEVDVLRRYYPADACGCGGTIQWDRYRRHQVFDLPEVRYTVEEHRCYEGCCEQCGWRHRAALPASVPQGQMGPGLVAWINLLNGQYSLSRRQIQTLLQAQWGLAFSLGAISQSQAPILAWLQPVYTQIGEAVRRSCVAYADETRHYRHRSGYWLWSLSTDQAAYFLTHYSRGKGAANVLLGDFNGFLVTDRHGGYNDYDPAKHPYCWAHVIRNLEKIAGRKGRAGEDGRRWVRLARLIVRCGKRWRQGHYASAHYRRRLGRLKTQFQAELEQAVLIHGKSRTGNACRKRLRDSPRLWTFLVYPGVPMTNNAAERALRPYVIWRKISFFCQSHRGNQFRPMILSLIETCKRLGVSVYQTLRTICNQGMTEGKVTFRLPIPASQPLPLVPS